MSTQQEPSLILDLYERVANIMEKGKHKAQAQEAQQELEAQRQRLQAFIQASCGHEQALARISLAKVEAAMGQERIAWQKRGES